MSTHSIPRNALRIAVVTAAVATLLFAALVPAGHASGLLGDALAQGGDGGAGGIGVGVGCVNVLGDCEDVEAEAGNGGDGGDAAAVTHGAAGSGDAAAQGGEGGDGGIGVGVGCVNVLGDCEDVEAEAGNGGDGGDALAVAGAGPAVVHEHDDDVAHDTPDRNHEADENDDHAADKDEKSDDGDEKDEAAEDEKKDSPDRDRKDASQPKPATGGQVRRIPVGGVQTGAGAEADAPSMLALAGFFGALALAGAVSVPRPAGRR